MHRHESLYTFEEAFERYQELCELYGHVAPVQLYSYKGRIEIFYHDGK